METIILIRPGDESVASGDRFFSGDGKSCEKDFSEDFGKTDRKFPRLFLVPHLTEIHQTRRMSAIPSMSPISEDTPAAMVWLK